MALSETLQHYNLLLRNGQRLYTATDHKNLVIYINSESKVETNRKLRLRESICQYNITPIYIKGKDNQIADFLSRQVKNPNIQINQLNTMKRTFKTEDYSIEEELREFQTNFNKITKEFKQIIEQITQNMLKINQDLINIQQQNLELTQRVEVINTSKNAIGDRITNLEETVENVRSINKFNRELVDQTL